MAKNPLPDSDYLNKRLSYNAETGVLVWKAPAGLAAEADAIFNGKCLGKIAGTKTARGYVRVAIDRKTYPAHCIIWKMMYGVDPVAIDHINGNPADNKLANLRVADQSENMRNKRMNCRNTSGQTGVTFDKRVNRWRAFISVDGKNTQLGYFKHIDDAIDVRKRAEQDAGYHPNHGKAFGRGPWLNKHKARKA